jgi:DNA-binding PadR family transcriptional regulator
MDKPEAYPITYGVLGLLAFWGPMSGYDLKRLFDHVLAPMWGAAHSQIYNELRRMKDLGWVEMEREEQETRPDRKVYHMTQAGQEALASWHTQPPAIPQLRDELLLKTIFGSFAPPQALEANLRAGIVFHEQRLLQYRQSLQHLPIRQQPRQASESEEDTYFSLATRFAIALEKVYLEWLYDMLTLLEEEK